MSNVEPRRESVHVALGERSYEILIGRGVSAEAGARARALGARAVAIVTDQTVGALHAGPILASLEAAGLRAGLITVPPGEGSKSFGMLDTVCDGLLAARIERRDLVLALGGGVVGDLGGFAAAILRRGVRFVQVPTSLLAQVDSSVGGKTAINHPRGKNMIGAFYQPQRVLADLSVLATLPARELAAGLAEVIKYGPIADAAFLDWVEARLDALLAREPAALAHAVRRSCELKAAVVGADEREGGLRAILNFGHTFGHAIEAALGYGRWLHGEAVGCGMVMAADLSARLGLVPAAFVERLRRLVARAGLPVLAPRAIGEARWLELMGVDKKAEGGELRFVLIEAPGRAVVRGAPAAAVRATIAACSG